MFASLVGMAKNTGIPVVWVPRASVLAELQETEPSAQISVLMEHADLVLEDCDAALTPVFAGPLSSQANLAGKAVELLRCGNAEGAQALAANVLDTVLRRLLSTNGRFRYPAIRTRIEDSHNCMLQEFRENLSLWPLVPALQDFHAVDPDPGRFNRHATAHAASFEQYTPSNALVAVMLATSLVREVHERELEMATTEATSAG